MRAHSRRRIHRQKCGGETHKERNPRNRLRRWLTRSVSRATSTRAAYCFQRLQGVCTMLVLHLSHPRPSSAFAFTLLSRGGELANSTSGRYCVTVYIVASKVQREREREEREGGIPEGAWGHGFGRKRYYFSQFAKQMLPIVRPPASPPCLCSTARKFIFPTFVCFPR